MKKQIASWVAAMVAAAGLSTFMGCSTTGGEEDTAVVGTPGGVIVVDTITATATVTAIDRENRKVTLVTPGGGKTTYKAGPEVVNFNRIEVGDQVKVKVTEQAAIYIGSGAPPSASAGAAVALAPVGYKPGGTFVSTSQVTARIAALDPKHRKVTVELSDGTTRLVKVGKEVNLAAVRTGDNVTIQLSEGLAISVEKP